MEALLNILIPYFKERFDPVLWTVILYLLFTVGNIKTSLNNHIPSQIDRLESDIKRVEDGLKEDIARVEDKLDRLIEHLIDSK